jgi:hypothetical protein
MIQATVRSLRTALWYTALLEFSKQIKTSFIVGSMGAFFSLDQCILPVGGLYCSGTSTMLSLLGRYIVHLIMLGTMSPLYIVYHLPTFFGTVYFQSHRTGTPKKWQFLIKVSLALAIISCIIGFVAHPVGRQVFYYAGFWLLPLGTLMLSSEYRFLHALGSTFTVHAFGTLLWIYTHTTVPAFWIALIPLVIIERLVFASGMTAVIYGITRLHNSAVGGTLVQRAVRRLGWL